MAAVVGIHADKDGLRGVAIIQIDVEGTDQGIADRRVFEGFGPAGPICVHRRLHFRSPEQGLEWFGVVRRMNGEPEIGAGFSESLMVTLDSKAGDSKS